MAEKKLVTVQQLDRAVDGFASAVAAAGYEKKANLKALAYVDEISSTHIASSMTTILQAKMNKSDAESLVATQVHSAYRPGGTYAFANLPAASAETYGLVYNMSDEFTTDARFIEGAGKTFPSGSEIAVVEVEGSDPKEYKYNVLSAYIDTTKFAAQSSFMTVKTAVDNIEFATATDIQNLIDGLSLEDDVTRSLPLTLNDNVTYKIQFVNDTPNNRPDLIESILDVGDDVDSRDVFNAAWEKPNWQDQTAMLEENGLITDQNIRTKLRDVKIKEVNAYNTNPDFDSALFDENDPSTWESIPNTSYRFESVANEETNTFTIIATYIGG